MCINNTLSESADSKSNCNILNEFLGRKHPKSHIYAIKIDSREVHDPNVMANVFNQYSASIGPKLAAGLQNWLLDCL